MAAGRFAAFLDELRADSDEPARIRRLRRYSGEGLFTCAQLAAAMALMERPAARVEVRDEVRSWGGRGTGASIGRRGAGASQPGQEGGGRGAGGGQEGVLRGS